MSNFDDWTLAQVNEKLSDVNDLIVLLAEAQIVMQAKEYAAREFSQQLAQHKKYLIQREAENESK